VYGVWCMVAPALLVGDVEDTLLLPDWVPRVRRHRRHFDLLVQRNHHLPREYGLGPPDEGIGLRFQGSGFGLWVQIWGLNI